MISHHHHMSTEEPGTNKGEKGRGDGECFHKQISIDVGCDGMRKQKFKSSMCSKWDTSKVTN